MDKITQSCKECPGKKRVHNEILNNNVIPTQPPTHKENQNEITKE